MGYFPLIALLFAATAFAQSPPAWVAKSNRNAQILIDIEEKYSPESATSEGVKGLDDKISSISEERRRRVEEETRKAKAELETRLAKEQDPLVKQDLQILIDHADRNIRGSEASLKTYLPYEDVTGMVFFGVKSLLDDQIAPERRPAALVRMKKYAGMESGYVPIVAQAEQMFRDALKRPGLRYPAKVEVQKNLENTNAYVNGIQALFEKYKIAGYQPVFAKLKQQLTEYDDFVRKEVLPKSPDDFRLPPEIYKLQLEQYGADYTPAELERMAHQSFTELQGQMEELARKVAKERGYPATDYRSVIRALKQEQIKGDDILPFYKRRLADIEDILRKQHLITLPNRPAIIKIASAAETAQQPAPHMDPPPLVNNHGERGAFVLPLETQGAGGEALKYDDFSYDAVAWTLTAHEARPGHELQFDAMVEHGVSLARAKYAFNSTNVEGWGLYSEWFMRPWLPDDGKLVSLDFQLLRAARAFLDPELQEGKITPDQAMQLLENDVVCSKAFATEEVERFTFRMPGQAVSYFDGFTRLMEIRQAAEKALGPKFDVMKFHDFVLTEGLLPPDLLRKAVMEDFVAKQ
ncbi:MAG TPA: DUF885 domain-containing protein [Bryobacteraceae bacterium]|nr:DUF885 domain-containing protein [Bryobacteraceae bacterium]